MKRISLLLVVLLVAFVSCGNKKKADMENNEHPDTLNVENGENYIPADVYETSEGELKITLVGHGSLMFEYGDKIIHIDPYSQVADYSRLPYADLIMITHEHSDHLDTVAINAIRKDGTRFIVSKVVKDILRYGDVVENGSSLSYEGIPIDVVPAYNMVHKKLDGEFYHPKGRGNGYVFTFADKKVYVAGDTENIPEMSALNGKVDIAFMPKNLPYTMDDDMFVDAVKKVMPKHVYPYHFSEFDSDKINEGLFNNKVKIIVKPMSNK